jgi:hypothetical protein
MNAVFFSSCVNCVLKIDIALSYASLSIVSARLWSELGFSES